MKKQKLTFDFKMIVVSTEYVNPLDQRMIANIIAAEALAGKENLCMNYLNAFRAGVFE